jgi:hypothetical protein
MSVEKPLDKQIVLQQTASASPTQFAKRRCGQCISIMQGIERLVVHLNRATHHQLFDLANGFGGVQTLGAYIDTVHDGVATEQAVRVF